MTYDAADGYVLLLGSPAGTWGAPTGVDAWAYSGGSWRSLTSTDPPAICPGSSLAYDEWDRYVVFFGAEASPYAAACPTANQTWSYHGGVWSRLHPTNSPEGRWGASFTNDSGDGYLLLFGGTNYTTRNNYSYTNFLNDSWSFRGGNWSQLHPSTAPPSGRSDAGLAYDPADGYTVLFGGSSSYQYVNDTWSYAAGVWTQLHPTQAPPVPYADAFTYDPGAQDVLYTNAFFPAVNDSSRPETTWNFSNGSWSQVVTSGGPPQREGAEQAYDYAAGETAFFGGLSATNLADTWSFANGLWTNRTAGEPGLREHPALAYDASDQYVVMFTWAGQGLAETWAYSAGVWLQLHPAASPGARWGAGFVYDAHDGYVLLFGGNNWSTGGPSNDSWEFAAGIWTPLTPTHAPSPRMTDGMVYDGADGYVLLFGGSSDSILPNPQVANGAGLTDTWSFQGGVWSNRTSASGTPPPSEPLNPMVYDASDGYVLLFGTYPSAASGFLSTDLQPETWSYLGGVWSNRTHLQNPSPPGRSDASFGYDSGNGAAVLFGGVSTDPYGNPLGDTWNFSGGSWQELLPPLSPNNQSGAGSTDDPAESALLLLGDVAGASPGCQLSWCGDQWLWTGGGVRPVIHSFTATPDVVDVGIRTTLTVAASENGATLGFSYTGLPAGCVSRNVSSLGCVPAASGSYRLTVNVTDPAGASSYAAVSLTVAGLPQILGLTAIPSSVVLGARTIVTTNASGGTLPYTYQYYGLPPGCVSQTVPALPCTPTASGNYTVRVNLSDAYSRNATASVLVTVLAAGGGAYPSITAFSAIPAAFVLGNSTNLSVNASGGAGGLSYTYSGLPSGCLSANTTLLACTPTAANSYTVTVSVSDLLGNATAVSTKIVVYPVGGGHGLLVRAFQPTAPGAVVGSAVGLRVVAEGGVGPLTFAFTGLPPGCGSSNRSVLSCTPNASGAFRIQVQVSDTIGDSVAAPLLLLVLEPSVGGAPAIAWFLPEPSTIRLGQSTVLLVNVSGGDPNRSFAYSGLPDGCRSVSTPSLPCTPTRLGTFPIEVRVTDAQGGSANATTLLTVLPNASVPPASPGGGATGLLWIQVGAAAALGVVFGLLLALARRPPRSPPGVG
jgi:hypothetical protein